VIYKFLIIGNGSSARKHFLTIKKLLPKSKVKFFSNRNCKKKKYLENFSQIKIFNPNLAIIANPSSKRVKIIKFLSDLKINILIEKPLAANFVDALYISKIFKKNKQTNNVKVAYNLRFLKSLQILRNFIKKNKIGKINFVKVEAGSYLPDWRSIDYKNSVSSSRVLGGGVLNELSHEIDYLYWIFGKFLALYSDVQKRSKLNIDVEDVANIVFFLKDKTPITLSLDFCRRDQKRTCYVSGTKGSIELDLMSNSLRIFSIKKNKWIKVNIKKTKINDTYLYQLQNIIYPNKKNDFSAKLDSALYVTKIIKYVRISSKIKKLISIK
jgi:predicted dehydrogenase